MTVKKLLALCGALSTLSLVGCGGGGSSIATGTKGTSKASVLVTDAFSDVYSHVWATIYHVALVPATGTNNGANVVLYDNPAGIQIDLTTLRDSTGARFSFLGSNTIPAGTYTAIAVTVGPTMQLFPVGATTGTSVPVDTTLPKDASGNPILTDTFKNPKTLAANTTNNLIVDFKLASFVIRDSKVIPVVAEGDPTGCTDPSRHNPNEYMGTVSNLTGTSPTLTFTLTYGNGNTATVTTTASTALFSAPTPGTGHETQQFQGLPTANAAYTLDFPIDTTKPYSVTVGGVPLVAGTATGTTGDYYIDASLPNVIHLRNAITNQAIVNITYFPLTTTTTPTLANGSVVDVTGTLDTTTQNLVATQVEVLPATGSTATKMQQAFGTASTLNATAGTFTLTAVRTGGFTPSQVTVNIVTTATTTYLSDAGATLAEADFFTALTTTPIANVQGTYDATSNTLTANTIRIDNTANDGGWEGGPHNFRPGSDANHWGNGAFPGPGQGGGH